MRDPKPSDSRPAAYDDDSAEAFEGTLMDGLEDEPPYPERDAVASRFVATWPKGADLDDGRGAADVWIIAAILRDVLGRLEALEAKP